MTTAPQLPPEVAEAMEWFEARQRFGVNGRKCAAVIRAELLRLTIELESAYDMRDVEVAARADAEAARDALQSTIDGQQSTMGALKRKLALMEMERNALRARIESAPAVVARDVTGNPDINVVVSHTLAGKRVRLVVEDGNA